jgi:hypothetical protein
VNDLLRRVGSQERMFLARGEQEPRVVLLTLDMYVLIMESSLASRKNRPFLFSTIPAAYFSA